MQKEIEPETLILLPTVLLVRWTHIASLPKFRALAPKALAYLASQVPSALLPLIETILGNITNYFGEELGGEMISLQKGFDGILKLGDVVAFNLIMQLESIGLNCSNWNNTGPTIPNDPGCMDVDPKQTWCYCRNSSRTTDMVSVASYRDVLNLPKKEGPGLCTSVVAQNDQGKIYHGRNLDWNIPAAVRSMVADIQYQRNGKTVFVGTTAVGFVGTFNGMIPGVATVSLDARDKGGKILGNLLQMLLHKSVTPAQNMRLVLQNPTSTSFQAVVDGLSTRAQIDQNYFIVGGAKAGEGAVVSRDRAKAADVWYLGRNKTSSNDGWYRLQTNYDHWNPVPKADDRRTPGNAHMDQMGQSFTDLNTLFKDVVHVWPTFNHHTDYTVMMSASDNSYESTVWMNQGNDRNSELNAAALGATAQCHSISPLVTNLWCNQNCNHNPSFCPPFFCVCAGAVCYHNTDAPDHKCYEACSTGATFHTRGYNSTGRCDRTVFNIQDAETSVYQCPDGVTNTKYCPNTALNITVATWGEHRR